MSNKPILFTARTDGSAVPAGVPGESGYLSAVSNPPVGASASYINLITKSLDPGVWAVQGLLYINSETSTGLTTISGAISLTSAALDAPPAWVGRSYCAAGTDITAITPVRFLSLSSTTTVYLVARADYSSAGTAAWGVSSMMTWQRIG